MGPAWLERQPGGAGFAERAGQPIRFLPFMRMAFPLMPMSIAVSTGHLYLRCLSGT